MFVELNQSQQLKELLREYAWLMWF